MGCIIDKIVHRYNSLKLIPVYGNITVLNRSWPTYPFKTSDLHPTKALVMELYNPVSQQILPVAFALERYFNVFYTLCIVHTTK